METIPTTPPQPVEEEEEEDVSDLEDLLDQATALSAPRAQIPLLGQLLNEPSNRYGPAASALKERAVYALSRAYCQADQTDEIVTLLTGSTCSSFFANVTKAKCAKVVRAVLDIVCSSSDRLEMQAGICRNIISWCVAEKRSFLRQRVEAKLASVLYGQDRYGEALHLVDGLLSELKKLDDKQLLVETHLIESKIHHGLRNLPKSKAALTASRTNANAIYVSPALQSQIDLMSGVLHTEEKDYDTAHSYFLEAFEQLDQMDDGEKAKRCLKYMMLCKILDGLNKALGLSKKGVAGIRTDKTDVDISGMISGKRGVKYAGPGVDAMSAIAAAASTRSLKEYEAVILKYPHELNEDLLIKHHLGTLHEQLLESNLIRIIEPYSCVEISHVAHLMEMELSAIERKLSQMILDGKFRGILDQGKGQLVVYEENEGGGGMAGALGVIENMDNVVDSLFVRSRALREYVI